MFGRSSDLVLITPKQMNEIDKETSEQIPIYQLMENAGRAVAQEIIKQYKPCSVLVLCGPGNNGGDGYVTARFLAQSGWHVLVASLGVPKLNSAAQQAAYEWSGLTIANPEDYIDKVHLVVDALFGAGLSKDLDAPITNLLSKAKHVVAIDVPSGLDGANGVIKGYAPHAELTVSFGKAKPGHYLLPGREYVGKLVIKDIGTPRHIIDNCDSKVLLNEPGLWNIPISGVNDYKYSRGIVSIIGGAKMTGATRISAHAALNAGAGLVHIYVLGSHDVYSDSSACFIIDTDSLDSQLEDPRRKVWVCGPGLSSEEVEKTLPLLIASNKRVIADAGALEKDGIHKLKGVAVVTPHIGEFKRVFGEIKTDRLSAVKEAASKLDCIVVLKGVDTLIADPDGRVAINKHASARLATAGSGDSLTGIIATLMATGMPDWEAACAAVWLHGEAAFLCEDTWPCAEMLVSKLGKARDNAQLKNYTNK